MATAPDDRDLIDIDERRLMAALSYVGVLVFVPYLVSKSDSFVYFHVRQGLVVFAAIVLSLIAAAWVPKVGSFLFLLVMLVDIAALVQALLGRRWRIPLLGTIAENVKI